MTDTEHDDFRTHDAVDVRVVHTVSTVQESPALYSAYSTFSLGATDKPIQIAGQDSRRYRVLIWADAKCIIGLQNEVNASVPKGATVLANSAPIELVNQQEVWVAQTGVAVNVSVVTERVH